IDVFCPLAYELGVRHFSVYSAQEAFRLLNAVKGDYTILCLGNLNEEEKIWAVDNHVSCYINNKVSLQAIINAAIKTGKQAIVHIEVETGMNRTGFLIKEIPSVLNIIKEHHQHIKLQGVCTHLAGAESITNYKRIKEQISRFKALQNKITSLEISVPQYHIACSAVAIRYPKQ